MLQEESSNDTRGVKRKNHNLQSTQNQQSTFQKKEIIKL
jgi:hypothetical protein